jgi:hypothetical protein
MQLVWTVWDIKDEDFQDFLLYVPVDSLVEDGEDAERGFPASPDGGGGAIEWMDVGSRGRHF